MLFRWSSGRFTSTGKPTLPMLALTTTGARSGQPHVVQLAYHRDGDDLLVVASAMGQEKHPAWRYNLDAHPERAACWCGGTSTRRSRRVLTPDGEGASAGTPSPRRSRRCACTNGERTARSASTGSPDVLTSLVTQCRHEHAEAGVRRCRRADLSRVGGLVATAADRPGGGAQRRHRAPRRRRLRAVRLLRLRHRDALLRRVWPAAGHRYSNFHTTALCSPTRACLLTGRNHHSNGMARIVEFAAGFPGYNADHPARERLPLRDPRAERVRHLRGGQVAPHPGHRDDHGQPAATSGRSAAASSASTGSWAARPTSTTRSSSTTTTTSSRRRRRRRATTSPRTWPTRPCCS